MPMNSQMMLTCHGHVTTRGQGRKGQRKTSGCKVRGAALRGHCPTFGGFREEHLALRSGQLVGKVLREEGRGQEGGGCGGSQVRRCRSGEESSGGVE